MKRKLPPPRIAALLIALAFACSAGAASAATAASSGSWFSSVEQFAECVMGNSVACMAESGVGTVTPDDPGDPSIRNKPN